MEDLLLTIAEIAAAFAGFASIVVVFRRRDQLTTNHETKIVFQSMLLSALFVIFFALLPLVASEIMPNHKLATVIPSALLLVYITATFTWAVAFANPKRRIAFGAETVVYFVAAMTIATTQALALLGVVPSEPFYLVGVFTLLVVSGFAFYSLLTFGGGDPNDA